MTGQPSVHRHWLRSEENKSTRAYWADKQTHEVPNELARHYNNCFLRAVISVFGSRSDHAQSSPSAENQMPRMRTRPSESAFFA